MFVCFLEPLQGFQVLLLENHIGVGFHPCRQRESEERFGVLGVFLPALPSELPRVLDGLLKTLHSPGIGLAVNAVQKFFLVQKEITREDILAVKLLEEIAGRYGDLSKG